MNEKHEIPYPCDTCEKKRKEGEQCSYYKKCVPFFNWFKQEWRKIQKTYEGEKNHE